MADTLLGDPAPSQPIVRAPEVARWLYDNVPIPETLRFKQLDRYEAHYRCTQYQHLDMDWSGLPADATETVSPSVMVPRGFEQPMLGLNARAKRPTAPYHLCRAIVDRFTGLLFSEGRKPDIVVENDPATEDLLRTAMHQARFWPAMRQARTVGGSVGSVCVTAHLREGKFALEVHNGKHLHVLWKDRRSFKPRAILKQYVVEREQTMGNSETGAMENRPVKFLVRRIITETEDIVFKPAELRDGDVPQMEVADSVQHNLGFFPGVWIQNLPVLEEDDGDPDCQGAWQTFDTIDRLIAQANKGALLNMDPTLVLKVDPKVIELGGGVRKGSDNSINTGIGGGAEYLEINGAGIQVALAIIERLKQNSLDMTSCVLVDPEVISGAAQSAKAIEYLYAPMLEKADILRSQYGDLGIVPLCEILIKMVEWAQGQGLDVDLPLKTQKFVPGPGAHPGARPVTQSTQHQLGSGGHVKLVWGPYFTATEQDKQLAVNTLLAAAGMAAGGALIDEETAIKEAAHLFKVKEPQAMFKKIKEAQDAASEPDDQDLAAGVFGAPPQDPNNPVDPNQPPDPNKPVPPGGAKPPKQFPPDKNAPPPPAGKGGKP